MGYPETMRDILELERKEELRNKKETLENHPIVGDIEDITRHTSVVQCNYFEHADELIKSANDILSQSKQEAKRK
jgi:hypothetical protein